MTRYEALVVLIMLMALYALWSTRETREEKKRKRPPTVPDEVIRRIERDMRTHRGGHYRSGW